MPRRACSIPGCGNPHVANGWCQMHYSRWRRYGDPLNLAGRKPPSQLRHGHSFQDGKATPEYNTWASLKSRCENPAVENYPRYGGRGIAVCDRWRNSFDAFLLDMGPRPSPQHSIDRYPDNDGPYAPDNCRWATRAQQGRNKRSNHLVIWRGREMTVTEAAESAGSNVVLVRSRIRRGWSIERALS